MSGMPDDGFTAEAMSVIGTALDEVAHELADRCLTGQGSGGRIANVRRTLRLKAAISEAAIEGLDEVMAEHMAAAMHAGALAVSCFVNQRVRV